ncbi:MAG: DEAD/DEAH box helicase [Clostridium sp.]|nr:DEAD/DEAH box helicase [Bacteroides sp.]MCM1199242.1 DEAD/DEAH box helicase [Clostridium sp.]
MRDIDKDIFHTSKIVDGYKRAFIDSKADSDPDYSPQFISNNAGKKVLTAIEHEMRNCDKMFISVAFITRGGIAPLLGTLKEMEAKGVNGRILTTDYLLFSEPRALDTLNKLSNIELRIFRTADAGKGFHTKGYMFHRAGDLRMIVGSSNLTQAAITKNYEWNTRMVSTADGQFAYDIADEFNELWNSSVCYDDYREEYIANYKGKTAERKELDRICRTLDLGTAKVLNPNSMQSDFINSLEHLIRMGEKRALLISATGTGKTYASAFAVRDIFAKSIVSRKKILFLSHREQINRQALKSYARIFGPGVGMGLLSGNNNGMEEASRADFLFSTMQMMAKDSVRAHFQKDEFSIIILDECHRSGAGSYRKIISYFEPELLLGMSASPERSDDFDVFSLFDHNIACEIRLQQALENELLCPFHYYGITDFEVDGMAADVRDFGFLTSDMRVEYIISKAEYFGYSGDKVRGLVFCSTKAEARELSQKFNATGRYRTVALCGDDSQEAREKAVARLVSKSSDDSLDYIFTVDIFNEGVDIPEINQVIMLRPTESPIIFVQQLGRGLRKAEGKEYVIVLDFIANYANNYMIPIALSGDRSGNKDNIRRSLMEGNSIISGASTIYFDEISRKRIYASIDAAKLNRVQLLRQEYQNLKYKLGRIPSLDDFDVHGELDPLRIIDVCGSYYAFLAKYEPDYDVALNAVQTEMMEFVSRKFASGKRPHELALLNLVLNGSAYLSEDWELVMEAKYGVEVNDVVRTNVLNVMSNEFFGIGSARDTFRNCIFLATDAMGAWHVSGQFAEALEDIAFHDMLCEVVQFGLGRYEKFYAGHGRDTSFSVGQKYTYEDVCRLLNWRQNQVATNIGGYKYDEQTKTYPVFINYHKSDEISETTKYEDRFVNPSNLIAISKSRRKLDSNDVQTALESVERGVRMDLFVRKNKDDKESKEFYYLGRIVPNGFVRQFDMPNTDATAVEIGYRLLCPVETGLYGYLTEGE